MAQNAALIDVPRPLVSQSPELSGQECCIRTCHNKPSISPYQDKRIWRHPVTVIQMPGAMCRATVAPFRRKNVTPDPVSSTGQALIRGASPARRAAGSFGPMYARPGYSISQAGIPSARDTILQTPLPWRTYAQDMELDERKRRSRRSHRHSLSRTYRNHPIWPAQPHQPTLRRH